jgi:hypothetical protein
MESKTAKRKKVEDKKCSIEVIVIEDWSLFDHSVPRVFVPCSKFLLASLNEKKK